jgi:hypothetical protein
MPAARERFLAELRRGYPVSNAAALAKCGRETVYGWRGEDPEVGRQWDDAYAEGGDAIEEEARRRGMDGWDEAVFQGGEQVGVVHRYSDRLLELADVREVSAELVRKLLLCEPALPSLCGQSLEKSWSHRTPPIA